MASLLISPIYLAKFSNGETLGLAAFVAAIVGGFNQVRGAIAGGLLVGVIDNLAAAYVSTAYRQAVPLVPAGADHPVPPAGAARPQRGARGMSRGQAAARAGRARRPGARAGAGRSHRPRHSLCRAQALRHLHPHAVAGDGGRRHGRQSDRRLCRPGDAGAGGLPRHRRLYDGAHDQGRPALWRRPSSPRASPPSWWASCWASRRCACRSTTWPS